MTGATRPFKTGDRVTTVHGRPGQVLSTIKKAVEVLWDDRPHKPVSIVWPGNLRHEEKL